jgi:hypothetical protein
MNQANSINKYAKEIIEEAHSEFKTWAISFHGRFIMTISKMSQQKAHLFIKIMMSEILKKNPEPFSQFKLCQICSIVRNQDLKSLQNAFLPFHSKIKEYIDSEPETIIHSVIKSHLTNLLREQKMKEITRFSNARYDINIK